MIQPGDTIRASDFRGLIMAWAGTTAPDGWLFCRGQEVSRTTYSDLYAIVGDLYGAGDGSTTFNLPDLRGSVIVGAGQKTRTYSDTLAPADINTDDTFNVGQARRFGNGNAVNVTIGANGFGRFSRVGNAAVDGSGWLTLGSYGAFLPNIGDKILICEPSSVNFSEGFYYVIETRTNNGGEFRVSTTPGGSVAGSGNSGSVRWVRVDDSNTEGYSGRVTWYESGDSWELGSNSMPAVGDRIACMYESSTSPNVGSVYTVTAINLNGGTRFTVGNLGSDSGTTGWVNLGQGDEAVQPYETGTYYTMYEDADKIKLAETFEDAIQGNALDIQWEGTDNVTIDYTDTLTNRSEGDTGGHEEDVLTKAETPDFESNHFSRETSTNNEFNVDTTNTSSSLFDNPFGNSGGGNQPHSRMQPFVSLNYIIKH